MKTYRIDAVYKNGYEDWLMVGCPEDKVGRYIDSYLDERTKNGRKRFKKIVITLED